MPCRCCCLHSWARTRSTAPWPPQACRRLTGRSAAWGLPGPTSGAWVIIVADLESEAFVGSRSATDIARFEAVFGSRTSEATEIVGHWEFIKDANPNWLREWLPAVLNHVLGPEEAGELLTGEGRWLAEL